MSSYYFTNKQEHTERTQHYNTFMNVDSNVSVPTGFARLVDQLVFCSTHRFSHLQLIFLCPL